MTLTQTPVIKKGQPDDTNKFQPLPKPSGPYPYHLSRSGSSQKMSFHMAGDTGNLLNTGFQGLVAGAMAGQYQTVPEADRPQFLYHLGDVVYNYGEAERYAGQFFRPFGDYPGPIFAIAGNHDSDVNPAAPVPYQSLDAFTTVFCDKVSRPVTFSESNRNSMTQPNVYWTLETPLANFIGLHSNVPKYGAITDEQRSWFAEELRAAHLARPNKALIVCVHHAPYSADMNHGSSLPIAQVLEEVFQETSVRPDIVFSGHVHNYQRFGKHYPDGLTVPYIVAGAGGYAELHPIVVMGDEHYINDHPLFSGVQLEHYCDDQHGFLKITIEKTPAGLALTGEYYTVHRPGGNPPEFPAHLDDRFSLILTKNLTAE
jgi:hypothetical protein